MSAEELERRKQAVVERYGPWVHDDIRVSDTLTTGGPNKRPVRLWRILQTITDLARKPIQDLRILDLACQEGIFSVELARHGARVVGIEGRESNVQRARFVKEAMNLDNLDFFQDDCRNLSKAKYGTFDVVLCLGLLYHLDAPDVFQFTERLAEVTDGIAYIDTHVGTGTCGKLLGGEVSASNMPCEEVRDWKGKPYRGSLFRESPPGAEVGAQLKDAFAALDTPSVSGSPSHRCATCCAASGLLGCINASTPSGRTRTTGSPWSRRRGKGRRCLPPPS